MIFKPGSKFDLSVFPEPISGFTHLVGAALSLGGLIWLVALTWGDVPRMVSVAVYGVCMVLLYAASTALHLIGGSDTVRQRLNRIDHAAIYLLIAGTYTPLCYNLMPDPTRTLLLVGVWTLAVVGIVFKLFFRWQQNVSTLLYVAMGWIALLAAPSILQSVPFVIVAGMAAGGIVYSLGAVVFALQKPNFHPLFGYHEVWHLFVLAGSAVHFAVVARYVAVV